MTHWIRRSSTRRKLSLHTNILRYCNRNLEMASTKYRLLHCSAALCLLLFADVEARGSPPGLGLRSKHENSSQDNNQTSLVWQLTRAREANLAAYNDVLQRQHPPRVAGGDGPMYELVLARWNEAMDWMQHVPIFWNITVLNKGHDDLPNIGRPYSIVKLRPDSGRETSSFSQHILQRWNSLAAYTVFSQGDPVVHSPHFIELLGDPALLGPVQAMSLRYAATGEFKGPPESVINKYRKHPWFRAERASLRTFNSVYFHDVGSAQIVKEYMEQHNVPVGTNIVAHFFDSIGLKDWVPEEQEVGSFAWGGLFGVHASRILQHPRSVYEAIKQAACQPERFSVGFVMEHSWLMLFGGPNIKD